MKKEEGFTLVEIIVTVVILAVLMAVAVPISMTYLNDVHDQKILSEAESVFSVAKSSSHSNRLSLEGKYTSSDETFYEKDDQILQSIVSKANGVGEIKDLRYIDNEITYMRYKYNETTYAVYTKETGKFVIETGPSYGSIADAIISNDESKAIMLEFLNSKGVGAAINSEADSSSSDIFGYGERINKVLKTMGFDTDSISWQIEKLNPKNGVARYQFLISNQKISMDMVGQTISAMKYIYFEDGSPDDTVNSSGEGNFNVEVKCLVEIAKTGATTYPVLKKK